MPDVTTHYDPLDESLWGEYARILLVGTTICSAAAWGLHSPNEPATIVIVLANLLALFAAIGRQFAGLLRLTVLSLAAIAIVALLAANQDLDLWSNLPAIFSPVMTLVALLSLVVRDGLIAVKVRSRGTSARNVFLVVTFLAIFIYMIVIPGIDAFLGSSQDLPASFTVEELSPMETLRVRSAKFFVFAIFAYAGACVGSFLNVVAASAPRGEPIALRSSACPQCGKFIRRIDNLPIISYLRLGGRCRDCDAVIPVRYFSVELVGLAIFSLLFLYELVTGAANVPGSRHYHYAGILWIILYTKWPVVGIYFFHCWLFSCLLMLALMEQDRLDSPRWMKLVLPLFAAGMVIGLPTMLTVSLGDQTPFRLPTTFPGWIDRAATSIAGGVAGWVVAYLVKSPRLRQQQSSSSLALAFVLVGISLGWQALLTIAIIWLSVMKILNAAGGRVVRPRWLTATTLLFAIAMLHHPVWKWLAERLSI